MKDIQPGRAALILACLMWSGFTLSGCGGGGGASVGIAQSAGPADANGLPVADAPDASPSTDNEGAASEEVLPVELLRSDSFAPGLAAWRVVNAAIVPSEIRSGGKALRVNTSAAQSVASGTLVPGRAYALTVTARTVAGARATVAVRFRKPQYAETFRTYKTTVADTTYQTFEIAFTAPAYTALAEVAILASSGSAWIDSLSLKMREPIAVTEPVASWADSHVPAGYELAFNDEFEGAALNTRKWFTRYIYGSETTDRLNDEVQRYRDNDNHRVADGVLSLVARRVSDNDPWGLNYESGMIRSDWTTRYGYFEARVKMPGGKGVWPAFWLNSDVSEQGVLSWPPEIDIFEFVHNGTDEKLNMLHTGVINAAGSSAPYVYTDPAFNRTWSYWWAPFNFNEGWHTIGTEWTPEGVTTYVDGRKVMSRNYAWVYANGTVAGPAHLLLNLAIGGGWAGRYGIDDTAFPQALQIDWVRAYKKAG